MVMTARECGYVLTRVRIPSVQCSLADIPLVVERHVEYILQWPWQSLYLPLLDEGSFKLGKRAHRAE